MKSSSSLLRKSFKVLVIAALVSGVFLAAAFFYAKSKYYDLPVLMYHHVSPAEEGNAVNVTPERFRAQMDFIKKHGYEVITSYEYARIMGGPKKNQSQKQVLLTFDDGYDNNYNYAYPVLKDHGFPAVIFVVVNKLGRKGYLTSAQVKEMQNNGIVIASHTLNEKYAPALSRARLVQELCGSKEKLEKITGWPVEFFAYCSGGYNIQAQKILKDAGYLIAFTTNRGYDKSPANDDPFAVRRIKVTDKDNNFKLWFKLSGVYNLLRTVRDPH